MWGRERKTETIRLTVKDDVKVKGGGGWEAQRLGLCLWVRA